MEKKHPSGTPTAQELEKVQKLRAKSERTKVDEEWLFIAEFGYYFGWEGVKAILSNEITLETANLLVAGARKIWAGAVYDHASAAFIGASSANSKKPGKEFNRATRQILSFAKADES